MQSMSGCSEKSHDFSGIFTQLQHILIFLTYIDIFFLLDYNFKYTIDVFWLETCVFISCNIHTIHIILFFGRGKFYGV